MNKNIFIYWIGKQYKLINILRYLINLHSNNGINYTIYYLNNKNIHKYIYLPKIIYKLNPVHQADYIRVKIILKFGGIWLDSDTIVMNNLKNLFLILKHYEGFFILENNKYLCNGIFGSHKNTIVMKLWSNQIDYIINNKKNITWNEIGSNILNNLYTKNPNYFKSYKLLNGLDTIYPVNWNHCLNEFIHKPYKNYKNIIRPFQPVIILVNSVYKYLENKKYEDIINGQFPLNYFIDKSIKNNKQHIEHFSKKNKQNYNYIFILILILIIIIIFITYMTKFNIV